MTNEIKMTKTFEIDDAFIGDVLVTAFDGDYGACYYWALPEDAENMRFKRVIKDPTDPEPLPGARWQAVEFHQVYRSEDEEFPQYEANAKTCIHDNAVHLGHECGKCEDAGRYIWKILIDKDVILRGIMKVLEQWPSTSPIGGYLRRAVEENDAGDVDAEVADCIVQCGLFGELVYG